ncbi:LysR family transcriptional regulator [Martelella alba]|uniref:LysR family transcriptional regulator n=1 Tax=Martelella alba TaxID=2590451 RepID=A0A506UAD7_9HYPH|nr:LysR family transcriptional regulator [Martelella alba]TPW31392.1 LysR family transcriptional regulator [Martelella alba]
MIAGLRHLCYFVKAAEHGSFRKAGLALGIQESAISRRIRDLEDELGASLFHRRTTGVTLTFAGQRFLSQARIALQSVSDGANDVAAIGRSESGQIKIGIFSSLSSGFLRDLLYSYNRYHKGVSIEFINGNPSEHVSSLRQLKLDIAFVTGTSAWRDCDSAHLWSERIFLVLPSEHPLTQADEVEWAQVVDAHFIVSNAAPGPEIRNYLVRRLADFGRHPDIEAQYVGRDNLMTLVAIGRGIAIASEATTAALFPGVVYRPIRGEVLPFSAVWSPYNDNPASRRMISMARQMAKSRLAAGSRPAENPFPRSGAPLQSRDPSR